MSVQVKLSVDKFLDAVDALETSKHRLALTRLSRDLHFGSEPFLDDNIKSLEQKIKNLQFIVDHWSGM